MNEWVLITGASAGIGHELAKVFAAEKFNLVLTARNEARLKNVAEKLRSQHGIETKILVKDLSLPNAAQEVFDALRDLPISVLVNNAGTAIPKPFEDTTLEELDRVIDLNVRGLFIATQAALKHLSEGGRIISIGSCVGERMMTPGLVAYSATKGAVKMFTQGLAREVGPRGITVNNVQPGPIDTDLNPADDEWAEPQLAATALKRYGHVDDIAPMVAFLAGPEAGYITGASLTVDGGTNA